MPTRLRDAVTVITGASSGIGRETARQVARQGGTLVLTARREQPLQTLAAECAQLGGTAAVVPADVTDEAAMQSVAKYALDHFGRLDVWVNNAAVSSFGRFEELPAVAFRQVIETNLFGYVHGARAALPRFREQGSGVLINVGALTGQIAAPHQSAYVASKFAIIGLSHALREELRGEKRIHVSCVVPASVDTPLLQHAANFTGRALAPLPPFVRPERVARAIVRAATVPRREVTVGWSGRELRFLHQLAPASVEWLLARRLERGLARAHSEAPHRGNLFRADAPWHSVQGGWQAARAGAVRRSLRQLFMGIAP